jgi:membrane protein DedA with SNARE-associated domain
MSDTCLEWSSPSGARCSQSRTLGRAVNSALAVVNAVASLPPALLYLVIVVWLSVESAAVPLPNEAILLFSGFLVGAGHLNLFIALIASVLGTAIGATFSWWVARRYGPAGVRKVGHYVFLTPGRLAAAERFFRHRGPVAIFLARLTPVIRTVMSYPAGLAAMPYRSFILATLAGCTIWNVLVLLIGRAAGQHWTELFERYHTPLLVAGVLLLLAAVAYLALEHNLKKRLAEPTGRA